MQIEVVDDDSTKEDLKPVVDQIAQGRVAYFRQPNNVGVTANFNTCLQRAHGHWIHILHGDDLVMPGFYEKLKVAELEPGIGAAFSRYITINENDKWTWTSELELSHAGTLPDWIEKIGVANRIQAPSIVVRRSVYEEIGGYDTRLFHCADWDMWKRIGAHCGVWYEPAVLACYRVHSRSDTSALVRSGRNIEDMRRSITISREYLPGNAKDRITRQAYRRCALFAFSTARGLLDRREFSAAWAQTRECLKTSPSPDMLARVVRMVLRDGIRQLAAIRLRARNSGHIQTRRSPDPPSEHANPST
jgi:glycosyltransferase involved in cell wall biosynthesis